MNEQLDECIPLDECEIGHLYRLESRNLTIGVYKGNGGFTGIRLKFHDRFLDEEEHWDHGDGTTGTAQPFEDIGRVPEGLDLCDHKRLFNWLDEKENEIWEARP